jgi:hypothetical protein
MLIPALPSHAGLALPCQAIASRASPHLASANYNRFPHGHHLDLVLKF